MDPFALYIFSYCGSQLFDVKNIHLLCSTYRFETTWGSVKDERFFGWTIPLRAPVLIHFHCVENRIDNLAFPPKNVGSQNILEALVYGWHQLKPKKIIARILEINFQRNNPTGTQIDVRKTFSAHCVTSPFMFHWKQEVRLVWSANIWINDSIYY